MAIGSAARPPTADPYLVVENLTVQFPTHDGLVQAVSDLSYTVAAGRPSASWASPDPASRCRRWPCSGLHNPRSTRLSGSIRVGGTGGRSAPTRTRCARLRGNDVAMIFQDPLTALHPFYSIGKQITEAVRMHNKRVARRDARRRAVEMLDRVGIPQAARRVDDYPHQFSGGMRQRAMIAMALVNNPQLLIADEPTTALDVTVQAQILDLLQDLQHEFGSAIVLITHDLGVIAEIADDVLVMYGGRAVENGPTKSILDPPRDALHLGAAEQRAGHHR